MAERLAELGMPIDPERVFALVQEGSAGRPHVARVMVERGYVKTVREAFDKYLAAGKPGARPAQEAHARGRGAPAPPGRRRARVRPPGAVGSGRA